MRYPLEEAYRATSMRSDGGKQHCKDAAELGSIGVLYVQGAGCTVGHRPSLGGFSFGSKTSFYWSPPKRGKGTRLRW